MALQLTAQGAADVATFAAQQLVGLSASDVVARLKVTEDGTLSATFQPGECVSGGPTTLTLRGDEVEDVDA